VQQLQQLTCDGDAASAANLVAWTAALHATFNALFLSLFATFWLRRVGGPSCTTQHKHVQHITNQLKV
jgi:hypothetical protein